MSEKKEFRIPNFMRKDVVPRELDPEEKKFRELREQYIEHFGDDVEYNDSIPFTGPEWICILTTCLEQNITFEELTGFDDNYDDDPDTDY